MGDYQPGVRWSMPAFHSRYGCCCLSLWPIPLQNTHTHACMQDIKDLLGAAKARENALKDMEASLRQNAERKQGSGGGGNATSSRAALPAVSS